MAAAFAWMVFLAFVGFGLPVSVLSLIWREISEKMTLAAAFVGVLRALIALGAVIAAILAEKVREKRLSLDLVSAGLMVEALGVIGFSLSRLLWHLCVWAVILGCGFGFSLTLLLFLVFPEGLKKVERYYAGAFFGIGTGAFLISALYARSLSWRSICQILGIFQIMLAALIFFLRRAMLKRGDFSEIIRKIRRSEELRRLQARREIALFGEKSGTDPVSAYFRKVAISLAAVVFSALILLGFSLWPESFLVSKGLSGGSLLQEILAVTGGGMLGCLIFSLFEVKKRTLYLSSTLILTGTLIAMQTFLWAGRGTERVILLSCFLGGAAEGPVFPALVLLDDVRFDLEAEMPLTGLIPAFYLGSWVLVTPMGQALVGGGAEEDFGLWLLALSFCLAVCLFFLSKEEAGGKKDQGDRAGGAEKPS